MWLPRSHRSFAYGSYGPDSTRAARRADCFKLRVVLRDVTLSMCPWKLFLRRQLLLGPLHGSGIYSVDSSSSSAVQQPQPRPPQQQAPADTTTSRRPSSALPIPRRTSASVTATGSSPPRKAFSAGASPPRRSSAAATAREKAEKPDRRASIIFPARDVDSASSAGAPDLFVSVNLS